MFKKNTESKKVIDFDLKKEDNDMEMKWYEKVLAKVSQNPIMTGLGVAGGILMATGIAILINGGNEDCGEIDQDTDDSNVDLED